MKARIYKPSKSAMQSGHGGAEQWLLEYESNTAKAPEPLMGWTASGDTLGQVSIKFPTLKHAKTYAENKGLSYTVLPAQKRRIKPRNYSDGFRYTPPEDE